MMPEKSGQPSALALASLAVALEAIVSPWGWPCLAACLLAFGLAIHVSHFLACHPPIHLHSFNPSSRDTAHTISHSQSYQHFISRPPATRACDLRCYALLPFALTCCTLACIHATGPLLLLFHPSASPSPTRALALRLHFHSHVQLR